MNFSADQAAINQGISAAYVSSYVSRLGAPSLMLTVSLDPRSSWVNGILENSRYAHFMIDVDGTIEHFSGSLPKFRKCRAADAAAIVAKINAWIAKQA